jgi:hypothetical protein
MKLILCPVDFSEFSVRAYRHALSPAEHYRAKLIAQHTVEMWRHPSASFAATANLYDECCQSFRGIGEEQLKEFVKNHTQNQVQPELIVNEGTAADAILSFAQDDGCTLNYSGGDAEFGLGCSAENCRPIFSGPARRTVLLLRTLGLLAFDPDREAKNRPA